MGRYRKVQSAKQTYKWEEPEQTLEGTWIGSRQGMWGWLGDLETMDGVKVAFAMPIRLKERLDQVEVGSRVLITYKGVVVTQNNRTIKDFDVEVWDEG